MGKMSACSEADIINNASFHQLIAATSLSIFMHQPGQHLAEGFACTMAKSHQKLPKPETFYRKGN